MSSTFYLISQTFSDRITFILSWNTPTQLVYCYMAALRLDYNKCTFIQQTITLQNTSQSLVDGEAVAYHLNPFCRNMEIISSSRPNLALSDILEYLSICCSPHIHLTMFISAQAKASSISVLTGHNFLHRCYTPCLYVHTRVLSCEKLNLLFLTTVY